ncbi:MAG: hypothetical protein MUE44_32055 [Oscillatoriaceae cyanobacterium Prado104]|jgi:hypothetical protein|nr:hypothetical protein [Oscillatoriaceae cyanobacterium Prado104]
MPDSRLIIYHKHKFSGRTLFLRLNGTVCQPGGLPEGSQVTDSRIGTDQTVDAPPQLLPDIEQQLTLSTGALKIDHEFQAKVGGDENPIDVYLAYFPTVDTPHEEVENIEGKFIPITEGRRLPPAELELLRLAYSIIMDD